MFILGLSIGFVAGAICGVAALWWFFSVAEEGAVKLSKQPH